jgi:hypothetical protein
MQKQTAPADNLSPKFWWTPLDGIDKVFEQMTAIELHGLACASEVPKRGHVFLAHIDAKGCFFEFQPG